LIRKTEVLENPTFKEEKKKHSEVKKDITVERIKPDGVAGYKLCRNTAPVAATNNSDFIHGFVWFKRMGQEKKRDAEETQKGGQE